MLAKFSSVGNRITVNAASVYIYESGGQMSCCFFVDVINGEYMTTMRLCENETFSS